MDEIMYDEQNGEPLTTPDTGNRTRINKSEGENPSQDHIGDATNIPYWKRLSNINTGVTDSFGRHNRTAQRYQERLSAWDIMAEHCRLTSLQKQTGRKLMGTMDTMKFGGDLFFAAFCLAVHVVRQDPNVPNDHKAGRVYHPNRAEDHNCPYFMAVADEFKYEDNHIVSGLNRVEACLL